MSPSMTEAYDTAYQDNRRRAGMVHKVSEKLEAWMHRRVAGRGTGDILEIGAGTLNHVPYEPADGHYDVIEPFEALYQGSPQLERVRKLYGDVSQLEADAKYGRIISIASLEHMTDLPAVISKAALHLAETGIFQAGIPSEGGALWGLSWRLSSGLAFRLKTGLDWGEYMRYEHINRADEIIYLARYFFNHVRLSRFPFPLHHASLYAYIEASQPNTERCLQSANQ